MAPEVASMRIELSEVLPKMRCVAVLSGTIDLVVLVGARRGGGVADRVEHPDDGEWHPVHVDHLTDRIGAAEQLGGGVGSEHGDRGVVGDVLVVDEATLGDRAVRGRSPRPGWCR